MLGCPVFGMIPAVRASGLRRRVTRGTVLHRLLDAPFSRLSETVRATRMGLALSNVDNAPKVILVTSAVPGEGKSTTAMLLAASSAVSGKRTVIIDCDLRRKSVSSAFEIEEKVGLVEVLAGSHELDAVVTRDEKTGLEVIAAGSGAKNPADVLNSQRMRDLMALLRERYDYVVLDASPLLPVVDAAVLATMVDKILFVIEWSNTPRTSVVEAMRVLNADSRRIAGIVVNKVNHARLQSYGYGYGYGYNYGRYYRSLGKYYHK
jgi:capsular exopolysaccharide synthesis family protein